LADQEDPFAAIPGHWETMRETTIQLSRLFSVEAPEVAIHIKHAVEQRLIPHRVRNGKESHRNPLLEPPPPGLEFVTCPEYGRRLEVENWVIADLDDVAAQIEVPFRAAANWFGVKVVGVRLAAGCNWQIEESVAQAATMEVLAVGSNPSRKENCASTIAAEKSLARWLADQMRAAPDAPRPKETMKKEANSAGHSVSGRAFDRAFGGAIEKANTPKWGEPGRRKSPR
jgi:hypothetical protein